jgi:hypothetical protein
MNIAKKTIGETSITFTWADESVTVVDMADLHGSLTTRAMLHGLSQKLGDSYSGAKEVASAKAAFEDTLDALKAGDWNRKGGGFSSGGIWVEALAQAAEVTLEEALEKWNEMTDETKASIRKQPQVKVAKAEIELARANAKAVDAAPLTL